MTPPFGVPNRRLGDEKDASLTGAVAVTLNGIAWRPSAPAPAIATDHTRQILSGAHNQHPSQPPPADPAHKKRRALADGPAFRAAVAAVDTEPASQDGGWKLLEGPPVANGAKKGAQ